MAQKTEFVYHNIELYKSESLGSGSFGWVCKAKCDGLLCAAKLMHPALCDLHNTGADFCLPTFQEVCERLSLARHPNVVQYLATYYDPDTRLPVLLMELCDENLTTFLERSPGPLLSYHIQINICHDIALALVYLHSNGLIHRYLTGNNVLMIAGTRAKITDFGMSKLATVNPRTTTSLSLCAGNLLYMSPEALDETNSHTAKLDIFSFSIVVIQILTRQFPNPINRFRSVKVAEFVEEVRVVVPETERRESQLKLIPHAHSLKPIILQCLKKEGQRPSAVELSEKLSELKQSSQYRESQCHTSSSNDIQQLQQQLQIMTEANRREGREHATQMMEKDKTISDLQQTISAHERQIQQLQQQYTVSGDQPQQQSVTGPQMTVAATKKDIWKMTWRDGKNAPLSHSRGAAVVHGNIAYLRSDTQCSVYSYQIIEGEEQWSELPNNFYYRFGLAVINGLLTSVGGDRDCNTAQSHSNVLLALTGEDDCKQWSEIFPPMPTQRCNTACITTEQVLVVAGGNAGAGQYLNTVEVMNINTKQWSTVSPLPQKCMRLSGAIRGDSLYLAGGCTVAPNSVFTCSISDIIIAPMAEEPHLPCQSIWKEIHGLPVTLSTLVSFGDDLLALGGRNYSNWAIADVYRYQFHTNLWNVVSQMKNVRWYCLAVTLPSDQLIVVGGHGAGTNNVSCLVEIFQ